MNKFASIIRKWLGIDSDLDSIKEQMSRVDRDVADQDKRLTKKISELDELTRVDADIGMRGNSTIVLTGVYRGKAYVQFYDVNPSEFVDMVERFNDYKKHNLVRNVDAPSSFKGAFHIR